MKLTAADIVRGLSSLELPVCECIGGVGGSEREREGCQRRGGKKRDEERDGKRRRMI